jgi:hypothetical protein
MNAIEICGSEDQEPHFFSVQSLRASRIGARAYENVKLISVNMGPAGVTIIC